MKLDGLYLLLSRPDLARRAFSSSARQLKHAYKTDSPRAKYYKPQTPDCPPYPYGPSLIYKQCNTGLYGGLTIQFGNRISRGRNKGKTRRIWRPNVRVQSLWSEALGQAVKCKVVSRVLRTIDKVGGLDTYLLGGTPARVKELGVWGWRLRWDVINTPLIQERFRKESLKLGIPESELVVMQQKESKEVDGIQDRPEETTKASETSEPESTMNMQSIETDKS